MCLEILPELFVQPTRLRGNSLVFFKDAIGPNKKFFAQKIAWTTCKASKTMVAVVTAVASVVNKSDNSLLAIYCVPGGSTRFFSYT